MSNKPGIFGVRLRYWLAAAGVAGAAAIGLNNDEPEQVPQKGHCVVHLDDKIGVKSANVYSPGANKLMISFSQGTNALGGKYTGEGIGYTEQSGEVVKSSVGDFHVEVDNNGTRAISCNVDGASYPVSSSTYKDKLGTTLFIPDAQP